MSFPRIPIPSALLRAVPIAAVAALALPATAAAQQNFIRGDCNVDGAVNIGDPVFLLAELFSSGPSSTCPDACDANDDSGLNIADAVTALSFLFSSGAPPPAPHPMCGPDPTADAVPCSFFPPCPTVAEICDNGADDDLDGATDCLDPECAGDPACAPAGGSLVINEVDYDQPGSDTLEFIEIHNPGTSDRSLVGITVSFINGATSSAYASIDLSSATVLPAGGYLVIHSITMTVLPPAISFPFPAPQDNVQNGAPDGIAIIDVGAGLVLDALSYEGSISAAIIPLLPVPVSLVEGTATAAADDNVTAGLVLIRSPNGADTDDAATDWTTATTPTPGSANP